MGKETLLDNYCNSERNKYRSKYGNIVDRIFNPEKIQLLCKYKFDLLTVFELIDRIYCDLASVYKLEYIIRISNKNELMSISFVLDDESTTISMEEDEVDKKTYIILSGFYLPTEKINELNKTINNKLYLRNGYRILKNLEIICKCWGFDGIKCTHITNDRLILNLLSEGYDNLYKLRGYEEFYDQDYVKCFLKDSEINATYKIQYKLK